MKRTAQPMTEADVQKALVAGLRSMNFLVAHFHRSRVADGAWATPVAADGKGFPDIVAAKPGSLWFFECKGRRGRVSAEQERWIDALPICLVVTPDTLDQTLDIVKECG